MLTVISRRCFDLAVYTVTNGLTLKSQLSNVARYGLAKLRSNVLPPSSDLSRQQGQLRCMCFGFCTSLRLLSVKLPGDFRMTETSPSDTDKHATVKVADRMSPHCDVPA